ncbi:tyrosine-type recombinase/integrase [Lactonifactor sp. BIOML-A3]|uniref:site-specific tyrosine recombinase/integron integrase n=1 Tax=unclassified Lactonifactor TaxID=2636670 RepID=UPI0012B006AB|nr:MULTISPECIES: site-specific tyrosine recombinase/integron integrase [unclassified Lactonifactor]MSA02933.1 tyrosine-type recombinase/integrase [Lactonifactor sp. BIOML-A5]MSA10241.1 tyrosine-type recombinase/integrase [Lactonifactor sp. BIOML-A4]MSA13580.1 tyrosine-type recombinase/integrase [Lactonifactor sp. BIOML-A3]MSA19214.1 tyrosine-type recombinase/integrase [Lactonifactor sp. BIOML-A2]MSA39134.1 tyrosine-type recombinase/integrase [Lactonifactor sp. BIOML-A1]
MIDLSERMVNEFVCLLPADFTIPQISAVKGSLFATIDNYEIHEKCRELMNIQTDNSLNVMRMFLVSKKVEGCTQKTIDCYKNELYRFVQYTNKDVIEVTTNDIRLYIAKRAAEGLCKVSQDNALRILRSFFSWCLAEEYTEKNPTLRIKKIKTEQKIKKPFSEIEIEHLRNGAKTKRDKAIIDVLLSTGMRIAELVALDRKDVDGDQIIVYGKGEKERYVYLNAKAIVSLEEYLKIRSDNNSPLFVTSRKPFTRLEKSGIETRIRELGKSLGIEKAHPHRFRRTAATMALNRGMPIEQVQKMLGHNNIETTLIYAQAAQENVKANHKKYVN